MLIRKSSTTQMDRCQRTYGSPSSVYGLSHGLKLLAKLCDQLVIHILNTAILIHIKPIGFFVVKNDDQALFDKAAAGLKRYTEDIRNLVCTSFAKALYLQKIPAQR